MNLDQVKTPALILDRGVLQRNCVAMTARMRDHGVRLRPHLKTAKSARVAQLATEGQFGGVTVSTLAEAAYFADNGFQDITYAVGIVPAKLDAAAALQDRGVRLTLLTDNLEAARAVGEGAAARDRDFRLLIEIDTGGQRAGMDPQSDELLEIGRFIDGHPRLTLEGVLTHAGQSYHCDSIDGVKAVAVQERAGVVGAAERLRAAGLPCPVVSAGSTPTAVHADSLDGVTEMRPGVYVFNDLDQYALGSCAMDDIAVTVLASVIGHNPRNRRILVDAGALALSKDISASEFMSNVGYGLISAAADTRPIDGLYVAEVHQEHGLIAAGAGTPPYDSFPVGTRVRILPNHSCMTAAAHDSYFVVDGGTEVVDRWDRVNGW